MTWHRRNRTTALQTPWLSVFKDEYTLPSGTEVDNYYVIERDDFVLVVAEQNDHVALVRQYRPATNRYYYSLPGGYLDGESPEVAARRELLEETGLEGEGFRTIGELHPLPGYIKSFAFVVVCRAVTETVTVRDQSEIESAELVPWSTALEMISKGEINEMQAVS